MKIEHVICDSCGKETNLSIPVRSINLTLHALSAHSGEVKQTTIEISHQHTVDLCESCVVTALGLRFGCKIEPLSGVSHG